MNSETIKNNYKEVLRSIGGMSMRYTIGRLRSFCGIQPDCVPMIHRIDELEQRYFYMLRMMAGGTPMPALNKETNSMCITAEGIAADIYAALLASRSDTLYASQMHYRRLRPEENLQSLVSDYLSELERLRTDSASFTDSRRNAVLERLASDVFMAVWTELPFGDDVVELITGLLEDNEIPMHHRVLWLNAVGLGACEIPYGMPDDKRRGLLLSVHRNMPDEMSVIAAIWLVVWFVACEHISSDHAELAIDLAEAHPDDVADIFLEFFRACGARALADNINRTVMPDLMNLGKGIADKLAENPDDIESTLLNSEWSSEIGTDGFDKIKSFIDSQNSGNDVYMATLGRLRQFPFFNSISNWFLPFTPGHSALADVTDGEGMAFADGVDKMPWLCDGDKYALILSVAQTPAQMRDNLLRNLADTHAAMNSEALEQAGEHARELGRRLFINRWVKNLYRFYTQFRRKSEFVSVFDDAVLYGAFYDMELNLSQPDAALAIARLLFDRKNYAIASHFFQSYTVQHPDDLKAIQQFGFALERSDKLQRAMDVYSDALLLKPGDNWTLRRLADLYIRHDEYYSVIDLLAPMEGKMQSDNELMGLYAKALMKTGHPDRALELFYNLEYNITEAGNEVPAELKAEQAWALTTTGDFESAIGIWETPGVLNIFEWDSMVRYAIALWCSGRTDRAIDVLVRVRALDKHYTLDDVFLLGMISELSPGVVSKETKEEMKMLPDMVSYRIYGSNFGKI